MKRVELIWTFVVFVAILGAALIVPLKNLFIFGAIFLPCIFFGGILVRVILMAIGKKKMKDKKLWQVGGSKNQEQLR
jgi:hypothetical protein